MTEFAKFPITTDRDAYVVRKALAYAIALIPYLPLEYQESSDRHDMTEILRAITSPGGFQHTLDAAAETVSHIEDRFRGDQT